MSYCKEPKVVICCPSLSIQGGVSNYYRVLKSKLSTCENIRFLEIGGTNRSRLGSLWAAIVEPITYVVYIFINRAEIIHLNPSLQPNSVLRTAVFVVLGKLLGRKIIVFWRGWNKDTEKVIREKYNRIFRLVFGKVDLTLVLAEEFREKLQVMGFMHPILVTTTIYDDSKINTYKHSLMQADKPPGQFSLFFMSRIVEDKGVRKSLEAFSILKESIPELIFNVAGDGAMLQQLKEEYAEIDDIKFLGNIVDDSKYNKLVSSDAFLFPSTYGEGMPNAVLEAMACGCPIITTHVGGLADFFKDEVHGLVVNGTDSQQLADAIRRLVKDEVLRLSVGKNNMVFAEKHFSATVVADHLIRVYQAVCDNEINSLPKAWYEAEIST